MFQSENRSNKPVLALFIAASTFALLAGFVPATHAQYPYIGEIKLFAGNFAPRGWAFAHGQLLSISENEALFSLIGTTYGGDGQTTFALPDLRGRVPVHYGTYVSGETVVMGQSWGAASVGLTAANLPPQTRGDHATVNNISVPNAIPVMPSRTITTIDTQTSTTGGGQRFPIRAPYLGINYIISLEGVYPSRN